MLEQRPWNEPKNLISAVEVKRMQHAKIIADERSFSILVALAKSASCIE